MQIFRPKLFALFLIVGALLFNPQTSFAAPENSGEKPVPKINDGFVLLPEGETTLGSPDGERQRNGDETRHKIAISGFYVDPYETRQSDYEKITGTNPSANKGGDLPVENVTWLEAVKYCNAKSEAAGLKPVYKIDGEEVTWDRNADGYRLLSEAEWEYACRAGSESVFNSGDRVDGSDVNFEGTYPYLIEENYVNQKDPSVKSGRYRGHTIAVDSLKPNAFGLRNMHGNVAEWVFDYYAPYPSPTPADYAGPETGKYRVNRGGAYIDFGKHLRSAYRSAANPLARDPKRGFRIARNAENPNAASLETKAPELATMPEKPKVLVAWFSYSGNTEKGAELIAKKLGADTFEIKMKKPYRGNIYEVSQKDLNSRARPELAAHVDNIGDYDVIILGYPTWWATMPMPVVTFLESHDLKNKVVLPFSSHGGTVFGESQSDLAKTAKDAYVLPGFEYHYSGGGALSQRIDDWLKRNNLSK